MSILKLKKEIQQRITTANLATSANVIPLTARTLAGLATVAVAGLNEPAQKYNLHEFVEQGCGDLPVTAQEVIDCFLSVEDEHELVDGNTPLEALKLHIQYWVGLGMPNYSGKPESRSE